MTSFYITTPIFYVNAQPHLGHAYTTVVVDAVSRFQKLCGADVRFQTGTDEHGDKIAQAAADAGISVRDYVDRISSLFREAWPPLLIEPDTFIRTTDQNHIDTVQAILQQVYDRGDIYFSSYTGLYCKGCERFLTEKELVGGLCPDHHTAPQEIAEQNYFFRMSKYQEWLVDHIQNNPEFITPERYRNEVLSFLKEPLEDLCISRPTSRLTWGIPLPFDDRFVTYVWFDALINYLSGIGYPDNPDFARYWSSSHHVVAKDILKPHAVYWPTMLQAIGLAPYKSLHVHGYWNVDETKMSKSLGNVVRPADLVDEFGADTVRYFLLREMSFGLDSSFSRDALTTRRNADLANDLGNLFSRSLTMVRNFSDSRVPEPGTPAEGDKELAEAAVSLFAEFRLHMNAFAFNRALQSIWELVGRANKYIVTTEPWELAKNPDNRDRLNTVLYTLVEGLRIIAVALKPIMPDTAAKMAEALGQREETSYDYAMAWGRLAPGTLVTAGPPLFPRLEAKKQQPPAAEKKKADKPAPAKKDAALVSFDLFKELDLRIAEIVAAEKVEASDRLLKLTVLAPEERTVVAGIAEHYSPEKIIGKQVILVANLKPATIMGVTSHGMVLAAKDGKKLVLSSPSAPVKPGSKVS